MKNRFTFAPSPGFMFRSRELVRMARVLGKGQSVLLVGIRNTGKTQLMKMALTRHVASAPNASAAYLDVSTITGLEDFYRQLLGALPKPLLSRALQLLGSASHMPDALMQWLRQHVDEAEGFGFSINLNDPKQLARYWEPLQAALESAVGELDADALPLLGIDEMPFMLENLLAHDVKVADITVMLAGLRKLRGIGLRMILGGSISMENLLTLHNIPHTVLGQFWREEVPSFTLAEARQYLARELSGRPAQAHINVILQGLPDHLPSHLDAAVNTLMDDEAQSAADVQQLIEGQVMPNIRRSFLPQFEERLARHYPGDELSIAEVLLDQVARCDESGGQIDASGLPPAWRKVLAKLQYDMYLRDAPALGHRFTLNLLRLWWRASRGMR